MLLLSLKILTRTFCNSLSYKKVLIMAIGKELNNSQKELIVKFWKDGGTYWKISSNLNFPFTTLSSFIARLKCRNTVENNNNNNNNNNNKRQLLQGWFFKKQGLINYWLLLFFCLFGLNDISTFVGYLMPNQFLYK